MKKAFQISRSLRSLSTLVLLAFMVLLWGAGNREYHQDRSNNGTPSQSDASLNFAILQDNNVFAILPYTSKLITIYFHGIDSFVQIKLLVIGYYIDVVGDRSVNFFVQNICNILTSIHAP